MQKKFVKFMGLVELSIRRNIWVGAKFLFFGCYSYGMLNHNWWLNYLSYYGLCGK